MVEVVSSTKRRLSRRARLGSGQSDYNSPPAKGAVLHHLLIGRIELCWWKTSVSSPQPTLRSKLTNEQVAQDDVGHCSQPSHVLGHQLQAPVLPHRSKKAPLRWGRAGPSPDSHSLRCCQTVAMETATINNLYSQLQPILRSPGSHQHRRCQGPGPRRRSRSPD